MPNGTTKWKDCAIVIVRGCEINEESVMRVGTRFQSKVTTITYVVTALIDGAVELKLDKDSSSGLIVEEKELKDRYNEVIDPYEANFLR